MGTSRQEAKNNKIHRNITKKDTKYTIDTLDTKHERVKGTIIPNLPI